MIDVPLCPANPVGCAAPAYLKHRTALAHPRDLSEHACLVFKPSGTSWVFNSTRGPVSVEVVPRLLADDNLTLLHSAVQGRGIAVLPSYVSGASVASGELQVVLADFPPAQNWFKACVPRRRHGLPRVQALLSWLGRHMEQLDARSSLLPASTAARINPTESSPLPQTTA